MTKPPHYRGTYHRHALALRAAANADPTTTCWRCGRTMGDIRKDNPRAKWTAGHLLDGRPGSPLAPECSPCNYAAGARLRNQPKTELSW